MLQRFATLKVERSLSLFGEFQQNIGTICNLVDEVLKTVGSEFEANHMLLLYAVENAGENGLPLSKARRYIPENKDLEDARNYLTGQPDKDKRWAPIAAKVAEKRGKNNEIILYPVKAESVSVK